MFLFCFFFFKQKTAYEMRISDWSSDVCSSDLPALTQYIRRFLPSAVRLPFRPMPADRHAPRRRTPATGSVLHNVGLDPAAPLAIVFLGVGRDRHAEPFQLGVPHDEPFSGIGVRLQPVDKIPGKLRFHDRLG